jgi:hypothetical protein
VATRFYLRQTAESTAISPTPDAGWEDVTAVARAVARTGGLTSDPMATASFADATNTDKDVLLRQYVSAPLVAGQTVTGSQALRAQVRCQERIAGNNLFLTVGIRVIAANGTTVQKTVAAVTRDATEIDNAALTNRAWTATSAATNYTTVAGDRLVIELGAGGDPANTGGADHDFDLRLGDAAASDLAEDDSSTADNKPWVQLTDTLTFVGVLAGTADLLFDDGSSVLSGSGALAGSGAVLFGEAAVLTGSGALAGPAALVLDATGTVENLNPPAQGGFRGFWNWAVGGFAAPAGGGGETAGSADLTLIGAGVLTGAGALAGAADLAFGGVGALGGAGALAGSADLALTGAGTPAGRWPVRRP